MMTEYNILEDLGFDNIEQRYIAIRYDLMRLIETELSKRSLTQTAAAQMLKISQPRVSDLIRGKIHLFTIDFLITILMRLDVDITISVGVIK